MTCKDFSPLRPFDIDDNQLDGSSKEECFVLGYELAEIDKLIDTGKRFEKLFHIDNKNRIQSELDRRNRNYMFRYMAEDSSESWGMLYVDGVDDD